jgi:hypothetical protein
MRNAFERTIEVLTQETNNELFESKFEEELFDTVFEISEAN